MKRWVSIMAEERTSMDLIAELWLGMARKCGCYPCQRIVRDHEREERKR